MTAKFALVGNPNVGKTAVFNALTGLHLTTGNYPGVTVERKVGQMPVNSAVGQLVDLPGAYSLAARSPDEIILADVLLDQQPEEGSIDGLVVVVDASNLERNLYFVSQLLELEKPLVVALNMMDIAERRGIKIDVPALEEKLGVPVVPMRAHRRVGVPELKQAIERIAHEEVGPSQPHVVFPEPHVNAARDLTKALKQHADKLGREVPELEAFRLLVDEGGYAERRLRKKLGEDLDALLDRYRKAALDNGASLPAQEARARYDWVRDVMDAVVTRPAQRPVTLTDRVDSVLTHKVFGTAIFVVLMMVIFQGIYSWAVPFMDAIDGGIGAIGGWTAQFLPEGMVQSLVVEGIIGGVGSVLVFLPQILLLAFFIALLEDCGYMARAAFLMDRLLRWCGLSGQSFIPMLSSFACAIPGIMATRTIQNRRDRYTTILVAPLMSCSARLPVYVIMIAAFVPATNVVGGWLNMQGLTLLAMYCLGVAVAVPMAWVLKKTLLKGEAPPFLLELPTYKTPQLRVVLYKVYLTGREFLWRAGTIIFAVTVIVWALAYFPRSEEIAAQYEAQRTEVAQSMPEGEERAVALAELNAEESGAHLRNSMLGRAGKWIEPVFYPMGWDWRIATATIASFPAREVIIATLGTLFNLGEGVTEESDSLKNTLQGATWPDGTPLFNIPVALSIMVFFALCCQCGATLAMIKRETGQWRWPIITFTYMTVLAYIGAVITYQGANLLLGG